MAITARILSALLFGTVVASANLTAAELTIPINADTSISAFESEREQIGRAHV